MNDKIMDEYNRFTQKYFRDVIGLDNIKYELFKVYALINANNMRAEFNLPSENHSLNMIFYGNPGTGKTTIARKVAEILNDLNYLKTAKYIEVDRSHLIGEYVGETTKKTRQILEKAKGGVLFIDEAYSLQSQSKQDYGKEAMDIILKYIEDNRNHMILILAGYNQEINKMITQNIGLKSRFPIQLHFKDYTISELYSIFIKIIVEKNYQLADEAKLKLTTKLDVMHKRIDLKLKDNGRFMRNLAENCIRNQSMRLLTEHNITQQKLITILKRDII